MECKMIEANDLNCYEFYCEATKQYGDFYTAQHMDEKILRSSFIRDIEAFAAYAEKELHLKKGDAFTIFCPTNIESLVAFYAFNKLGVITNFVHPLLPAEVLEEYVNLSKSKGIMILDVVLLKGASKPKEYIDYINRSGLPCIMCRNSDYASKIKKYPTRTGEALLEKIFPRLNNGILYSEITRRFNGRTVPGLHNNGNDICCYLNGGGTTGKSKTIKITAKALNELVHKMGYIDEIQDPGEEAEIIILPLFHAFGLGVACHMALCNAARLIPLMQFDGKLVVKLYKKNRISGIGGIPNMFKKLYKTPGFDGPHLANTRMMFVGGDDLSPAFLEEFNSMLERNGTSARLRQGYGLTEVCAACCTNTNWVNKDGSIGKPLEGIRIEIWDEDCHKVPNGTVGEICISGSTNMSGYLTPDGEENAGLYFDEEGNSWVRSGDLGYRDDDGFFFFAGRKKRLIIISGYNVYPVDIENLMDTLPFVKESCAVKGKTAEGRPLVKLYVSLKEQGDEEDFRRRITECCEINLQKFSVPREIVFMDELPHTPLEKVDFMKLEKLG